PQTIQKPDQHSRQAVTKRGVPRQRSRNALLPQARTQRNIGTAVNDWSQEKRQLSRSVAVITVEEHYDVRATCTGQSGQTGATVSATRLVDGGGYHLCGNVGC